MPAPVAFRPTLTHKWFISTNLSYSLVTLTCGKCTRIDILLKLLLAILFIVLLQEGNDEIADKLEEITPEYYMNSIISLNSK